MFAHVPDPSPDFMKQFGVQKLPWLQLMIAMPAEESGQVGLRAVPYDRTKFGGLKFKNAVRFLVQAQSELQRGNMWPKKPESKV